MQVAFFGSGRCVSIYRIQITPVISSGIWISNPCADRRCGSCVRSASDGLFYGIRGEFHNWKDHDHFHISTWCGQMHLCSSQRCGICLAGNGADSCFYQKWTCPLPRIESMPAFRAIAGKQNAPVNRSFPVWYNNFVAGHDLQYHSRQTRHYMTVSSFFTEFCLPW